MFGVGAGRSSTITRPRERAWATALRAALFTTPIAAIAFVSLGALAQESKPSSPPAIERRVEEFVAQVEAKRKDLGVVGAAVVVAHGDWIVRSTGLGQRCL